MSISSERSQVLVEVVRDTLSSPSGEPLEVKFPHLFGEPVMSQTIARIGLLASALDRDHVTPHRLIFALTELLDRVHLSDQDGANVVQAFAGPSHNAHLYRSSSQTFDLINVNDRQAVGALILFLHAWVTVANMAGNSRESWKDMTIAYKSLIPVVERIGSRLSGNEAS